MENDQALEGINLPKDGLTDLPFHQGDDLHLRCARCFKWCFSYVEESCGHCFCFSCIERYLARPVHSEIELVSCAVGCRVKRTKNFFELFSLDYFVEYEHFRTNEYLKQQLRTNQITVCPNPRCLGKVPVHQGAKHLTCRDCKTRVCSQCKRLSHPTLLCHQAAVSSDDCELPFALDGPIPTFLACEACGQEAPSLIPESCGHQFCETCIREVIERVIQPSQPPYTDLQRYCPNGCRVTRSNSFVKHVAPDLNTKYCAAVRKRYREIRLIAREAITCPQCFGCVILYEKARYYVCENCHLRICKDCFRHEHPTVSCKEALCNGTEELPFYTKPPKYLYCFVCEEQQTSIVTESCGHYFCKNCLANSFKTASEDLYSKRYWTHCLWGCSVQRTQAFFKAVAAECFENYKFHKRMAAMQQKVANKQAAVCGVIDCWGVVFLQDNAGAAKCIECQTVACRDCLRPDHPGSSCDDAFVNCGERELAQLAEEKGWKPCPICQTYIELDEGCSDMTCLSVLCQGKTIFCFECSPNSCMC